jgi:hypothetical protein
MLCILMSTEGEAELWSSAIATTWSTLYGNSTIRSLETRGIGHTSQFERLETRVTAAVGLGDAQSVAHIADHDQGTGKEKGTRIENETAAVDYLALSHLVAPLQAGRKIRPAIAREKSRRRTE